MSSVTSETLAAALRDVARIRAGFLPSAAELSRTPLLSHLTAKGLPGGWLCLVGMVSGHPRIAEGWCTTSAVVAANVEAGWVRTISRCYQLGPVLGEVLQ